MGIDEHTMTSAAVYLSDGETYGVVDGCVVCIYTDNDDWSLDDGPRDVAEIVVPLRELVNAWLERNSTK